VNQAGKITFPASLPLLKGRKRERMGVLDRIAIHQFADVLLPLEDTYLFKNGILPSRENQQEIEKSYHFCLARCYEALWGRESLCNNNYNS
jgi:hypothetical protein